ncbi:MAG: M48 family metallopeptidase [Bacillota bacterium]|uniref:DUF45 domain-containing protein n=1 Tax=Thermanaerosceptrum fracticalcis TaxID=1712410 RepID=A0A7G6DZ47_THEFR|nr:M48 family metallopeptidase [Thermanaerosceptrum fracticalcis]QNB45101.1 DUF45 domain-containing protein [Thermanaerosceptrum fracticalcis]
MKIPRVVVEYRDKKNSSGKVVDGIIHLVISSRLTPEEREEHIRKLTARLSEKINWARGYQFSQEEGPVKTDQELFRLAETINKAYYNFEFTNISFHLQRSTWGTCSLKSRQIYISHRLIGAPLELLWYVVTHELCHLAEASHNKRFWNLVSKACPNYEQTRKALAAYGLR